MMLIRLLVLLMTVGCVAPVTVEARSRVVTMGEPVYLEADELSYHYDQDLYQASGNVRLTQGELEVSSEQMQWNRGTGEVEARGNVQFLSATETLTGSAACYNLITGSGRVEQGYFFLHEDNLHVRGSTIEQLGEDEYRITAGTLTTCDGDTPAWKFGASRIDVTMGGYARARNTLFYLKDIPAFYFPYVIYPAKTERESGLLIPSIGYSKKRGFGYGGAYYQVLGINQDVTLYVDYLSEMGIGKGLEYRYIFGQDHAGEARVYHINVDRIDGERIDAERYALEWQHAGQLAGGVRMVADALYVNDDEYFKDFGDVAGDYNRDHAQSLLSLSKSWQGRYSLVGFMRYTKNLQADQDTTLQLLPRIAFDVTRQRIAQTPFSYNLATEYSHFWRREGEKGQRLMLRPALSMNTWFFNLISVEPTLAYRQRYYWGLNDDASTVNKGIAEFSTVLSTPSLQRIYPLSFAASSRLRHSLHPEVVYSYIPKSRQDHLPSFDMFDRIDATNRFEYALVQRLRLRTDAQEGSRLYRDLLYLRLSLLQHLANDSQKQGFGAVRVLMTARPLDRLRLSTDVTYDTRTDEWERILLEGAISDSRENQLRLLYNEERARQLEYGAVNLSLTFLKPLYVSYEQRYDFHNNERLEQLIGFEYRQQCWSVHLGLRERIDGERSFMLTFTMLGIGSVGGIGGNLGGI